MKPFPDGGSNTVVCIRVVAGMNDKNFITRTSYNVYNQLKNIVLYTMAENDEATRIGLESGKASLSKIFYFTNISVVELSEEFFNTFIKDYQIQIEKVEFEKL